MKLVFSFILLAVAAVVSSQDEEYRQVLLRYQQDLERFEYEQQQKQIRFLQQQQQRRFRYEEEQNQYQDGFFQGQRINSARNRLDSRQNNARETYRTFSTPTIDGSYSHGYSIDDGTSVQAIGESSYKYPINFVKARGSNSHVSPEGIKITTNWIADENGYQPRITYEFPRG